MKKPRILVLGAGFAGLEFCRRIDTERFEVTLIDRQNHHLFQPLLYQVASSALSVPDIAQPIRMILNRKRNLSIRMESVESIDLQAKVVSTNGEALNYDYLIIALGAVTSYFGHKNWEAIAPGLKSIKDATLIRQSILQAFERAEISRDPQQQKRLLTTIVIGGGPTGVELAGAIAELERFTLSREFQSIRFSEARTILIEAADRLLMHMDPKLSQAALRQLEQLGVEVRLGSKVVDLEPNAVQLENERIEAGNILWTAGVAANPIAKLLGVPVDRAGKLLVQPDLSLPEHPEVFALGDIASLVDAKGQRVPAVSPAALQMARFTAKIFKDGKYELPAEQRPAFTYRDKGTMATIGRSRAVAQIGKIQLTGFIAWLSWLLVHLIFLVGFRNKIAVLSQWVYSYVTYRKGARIIHAADERHDRKPDKTIPPSGSDHPLQ